MAKIGKAFFRCDQHYGYYDIFYSSKDKEFYVDVTKLFVGADEFFDSIIESEVVSENQKSINMSRYTYGRNSGMRKIYALTQKDLEDSVNKFNRMFVTTSTSEAKVILYSFDYKTETQNNDSRGMHQGENHTQQFEMGFKYRIAMKKTLGENCLYTDCSEYRNSLSRYDIKTMKEIAWTQELEDFIKSFSKAFDGLIDKMKPFFETEGRIMELIGRNILAQ